MFLFLIELYVLGGLIVRPLADRLPAFFLSVVSILVGYLAYFLNGFILTALGVPLTRMAMIVLVSLELAAALVVLLVPKEDRIVVRKKSWLTFVGVGGVYLLLIAIFFYNNLFFATTDTVYLVVMAQNLLQSGLSQWYFASPRGMGLLIPFMQTIAMLFGHAYAWFIQPIFMAIFLALFVFSLVRAAKPFVLRKKWLYVLVGSATLLFFTTDLIFIMTTYIHTNFDSGLFLFLAFITIYFGITEDNKAWFSLTPLFLIGFGALRTENVIVALCLLLIFVASRKISPHILRRIFLPYIGFQFLLFLRILFIDSPTYSDQMSSGQIVVVLVALLLSAVFLFLTEVKLLKERVFPLVWWVLPIVILLMVVAMGLTQTDQLVHNLSVTLKNVLITGNWGAFWYAVAAASVVLPRRLKTPLHEQWISFIVSFILIIQLLGLFRHPYHDRWYDSANRMLVHITPLILFFVIMRMVQSGIKREPLTE